MTNPIVFLDIDGTILDHEKEVPQASREAIQKLKDNGVHVAIATGRAPFMFEDLRKELDIHSYISFNGQYVVFEDEVVYENPLSKHDLDHLFNKAQGIGHPMVFLNHKGMRATEEDYTHIRKSLGSLKFDHPEIDSNFYKENYIYQALLFCESHEEEQYHQSYDTMHFLRWHEYSMDVLPMGGSKAIGIQKFIERVGIPHEHTYAFGDGLNDREMLQYVANGIAMGNASDEVKELADHVTKDVSEDGLYHGFKLVGLLDK